MRKIFLLIVAILTFATANAQHNDAVFMYGVDFSYVKVYGADESISEFVNAFERINMLLVTEYEKYDFSKIFERQVEINIEPILKLSSNWGRSDMKVWNSSHEESVNDFSGIIQNYDLPQREGVGAVLIAKKLDKPRGVGIYELLVFDIASREISYQREVGGRAAGFGLRNFWARTIYSVINTTHIPLP